MAADRLEAILCMIHQFWFGWTAKEFRERGPILESALVSDCKSLYTHLAQETNATKGAEDRLAIDNQILKQGMQICKAKMWWVNNNHMPADALTKFSQDARQDLLLRMLQTLSFRISYCEVSGRREKSFKRYPQESSKQFKHFEIDSDEEEQFYVGEFGDSDNDLDD